MARQDLSANEVTVTSLLILCRVTRKGTASGKHKNKKRTFAGALFYCSNFLSENPVVFVLLRSHIFQIAAHLDGSFGDLRQLSMLIAVL